MKSELTFLMDLFLNDEVPMPIKKLIVARVREVEKALNVPRETSHVLKSTVPAFAAPASPASLGPAQAPSMQRIMAQNPDLVPAVPATPAAANALAARAATIQRGLATDKPEPGRTGPRKF